jgi:hypothetical protein
MLPTARKHQKRRDIGRNRTELIGVRLTGKAAFTMVASSRETLLIALRLFQEIKVECSTTNLLISRKRILLNDDLSTNP